MKYYRKDILVERQNDNQNDKQNNYQWNIVRRFNYCVFSMLVNSFSNSICQITQKCTLHFLAQIMCSFFVSPFCTSTSQRPPKHLLSTFSAPSKDAESTYIKNIVPKLFYNFSKKLNCKNPQTMSRPPPIKDVRPRLMEFFHTQKNN
jgi:hypothetical protein